MLESQRGFLFIAFAALSFFLWTTWQQEQQPKPVMSPATEISANTATTSSSMPAGADVPVTIASSANTDIPAAPGVPADAAISAADQAERFVELRNDKVRILVDRVGGDIVESDLLSFRDDLKSDKPIRLLQQGNVEQGVKRTYIAQTGITGANGPDASSQRAAYTITRLSEGNGLLLSWKNDKGLQVEKTYRLDDGSHLLNVDYKINNQSSETFTGRVFTQLKRDRVTPPTGIGSIGTYTGAAFGSSEKRYAKYDFDDMDEAALTVTTDKGWVAYLQHYFLSAWIPGNVTGNDIYSRVVDNQLSIIGMQQALLTVAPGTSATASARLYQGPKSQAELAQIAEGLDLTVDYGFLWWIGQPLFALLKFLHGLLGNWGLAIIFVTVVVKALLYPLSNVQYRSFAKMRKLQPKLEALKERFGDDRQAFGQAMMELYKTEKVNPLGGCFPLLLQMPVFFALYWVLLESVEMRQSPFYLWIHDLSAMDPYYVLPLLMGISMWYMQKMQPVSPTMDPMQQKIMQYMPVMMTVFFVWAPAGLVLYWFMNNLLSMGQQWYITNKIQNEDQKKK